MTVIVNYIQSQSFSVSYYILKFTKAVADFIMQKLNVTIRLGKGALTIGKLIVMGDEGDKCHTY